MRMPEVSIVIPMRNAEGYMERLLGSLKKIKYEGIYEVILVDNNSTDKTYEVIKKSGFKVLSCPAPHSSYAARNVGIKNSKYDIIAFTDADCRVDSNWLTEAVLYMKNQRSDMVAGKVEFEFKSVNSSWEIYDSIVNMDNKYSVSKGCAKTANILVRKELFYNKRFFIDEAESGEDVKWTKDMVKSGKKLCYCNSSIVYHPTRNKEEALQKALRVGKGNKYKYKTFLRTAILLKGFLPPNPFKWKKILYEKRKRVRVSKIYMPIWKTSVFQSIGLLRAILKVD